MSTLAPNPTCDDFTTAATVHPSGLANVLILDDDPALRELYDAMLERVGCRREICSSSERAIAAYRSAGADTPAFDCALIDLHIGEAIDGIVLGRILREINPRVRLVLVSGSINPRELAVHETLGFDAVLPKPFNLSQLREVISPKH